MALLTDSDIVTLDDLLQFESTLVQVSSSHGNDVNTKIKLATEEISDKISLFLIRAGKSDPQWSQRARLGLSTVVVTPSIYKWLCCASLSRSFAEAYNAQLNTRFQGKWNEYQKQADSAGETVMASGIGIVFDPLPRPALPRVSTGVGSLSNQTLFVQTTWVDACGNESAPSHINGVILNGFASVQVAMSESSAELPKSASGWNVYVSETQQSLSRQNDQPLALGASWSLSMLGLAGGMLPPVGQSPQYFISSTQRWQRG